MNIGDLVGSVLQTFGDAVPGLQQAIEYDRMMKMDKEEKKRYQEGLGFKQRQEGREIGIHDWNKIKLAREMALSTAQSLAMDGKDDNDLESTLDNLLGRMGINDTGERGAIISQSKAAHRAYIKDVQNKDIEAMNIRTELMLKTGVMPDEETVNKMKQSYGIDPAKIMEQHNIDRELEREQKRKYTELLGHQGKYYSGRDGGEDDGFNKQFGLTFEQYLKNQPDDSLGTPKPMTDKFRDYIEFLDVQRQTLGSTSGPTGQGTVNPADIDWTNLPIEMQNRLIQQSKTGANRGGRPDNDFMNYISAQKPSPLNITPKTSMAGTVWEILKNINTERQEQPLGFKGMIRP